MLPRSSLRALAIKHCSNACMKCIAARKDFAVPRSSIGLAGKDRLQQPATSGHIFHARGYKLNVAII